MTLALGILFWIIAIVLAALWIAQRPSVWPWPSVLLFVLIVILGIAQFGGLHLVR